MPLLQAASPCLRDNLSPTSAQALVHNCSCTVLHALQPSTISRRCTVSETPPAQPDAHTTFLACRIIQTSHGLSPGGQAGVTLAAIAVFIAAVVAPVMYFKRKRRLAAMAREAEQRTGLMHQA